MCINRTLENDIRSVRRSATCRNFQRIFLHSINHGLLELSQLVAEISHITRRNDIKIVSYLFDM